MTFGGAWDSCVFLRSLTSMSLCSSCRWCWGCANRDQLETREVGALGLCCGTGSPLPPGGPGRVCWASREAFAQRHLPLQNGATRGQPPSPWDNPGGGLPFSDVRYSIQAFAGPCPRGLGRTGQASWDQDPASPGAPGVIWETREVLPRGCPGSFLLLASRPETEAEEAPGGCGRWPGSGNS